MLEHCGAQRAQRLLLLIDILSAALLLAVGVLIIIVVHRRDPGPAAWAAAVPGMVALWLWWRWVRFHRASLRQLVDAQHEETGVWGVGGPNVRTPGGTGVFAAMRSEHQDRKRDHDDDF